MPPAYPIRRLCSNCLCFADSDMLSRTGRLHVPCIQITPVDSLTYLTPSLQGGPNSPGRLPRERIAPATRGPPRRVRSAEPLPFLNETCANAYASDRYYRSMDRPRLVRFVRIPVPLLLSRSTVSTIVDARAGECFFPLLRSAGELNFRDNGHFVGDDVCAGPESTRRSLFPVLFIAEPLS